ncbi:hypothetical protein F4V43_01975 [Paenibacillus spiritus]|uniref:DUF4365 domain-containing protein n=1 Tax=Paenibacillus spiritus TaxID=2496557 RepID=A0A5J5GGQ7_9BACL|nr:hypothetical protein [Paenibacillus spiritus]KAA9007277.1 hypothetical protein F4V43_01975 [Paenibacillus spiritus]
MNDYAEQKSARHSKVTGDYGEYLVLYYLSREGFSVAHVDQIGLDIVGRNNATNELIGISVKTRSGKQPSFLVSKDLEKEKKNIEYASNIFGCKPYYAFVMDYIDERNNQKMIIYIVKAERVYSSQKSDTLGLSWSMSKKKMKEYRIDSSIIKIEINHEIINWF